MIDLDRIVRHGFLAIALGGVALGGWAGLAPLSGAVIAPGFVKVDLNRKVVQHQEGGTVREIRVRDGEQVRQGQVLVVLEDVRVDATLDLLSTELLAQHAKLARLGAEAAYAERIVFPVDVEEKSKMAEILERERAVFRVRRASLEAQVAALRKQMRESTTEADALRSQIEAEERALELQKEELEANENLLRRNYVQKTRVLTLRRAVAEYQARHGEHRAELARTRQRGAELELRVLGLQNGYKQAAIDELKNTTARINELEERLRPSKDAVARQQVPAPIAGEVVGMRVFNAGGVVGPREVLMEIIPEDKRLVIEARIRPEDINHVRPGAPAQVRLTAFQQRTTPLVEGTVTYVSGDRLVEAQGGAAYYLMHVDVPPDALAAAGQLRMQAGMPAEVFVQTDSRTTADYLLAPIAAYLRRSMREPL